MGGLKIKYVQRQLGSKLKRFYIEGKKKKIKKGNPHYFMYLINESGKICVHINTHFSVHPSEDTIKDGLLGEMATQLHFDRKKDFEDYINCTKSYDWYISLLRSKGIKTE